MGCEKTLTTSRPIANDVSKISCKRRTSFSEAILNKENIPEEEFNRLSIQSKPTLRQLKECKKIIKSPHTNKKYSLISSKLVSSKQPKLKRAIERANRFEKNLLYQDCNPCSTQVTTPRRKIFEELSNVSEFNDIVQCGSHHSGQITPIKNSTTRKSDCPNQPKILKPTTFQKQVDQEGNFADQLRFQPASRFQIAKRKRLNLRSQISSHERDVENAQKNDIQISPKMLSASTMDHLPDLKEVSMMDNAPAVDPSCPQFESNAEILSTNHQNKSLNLKQSTEKENELCARPVNTFAENTNSFNSTKTNQSRQEVDTSDDTSKHSKITATR